MLMDCYNNDHYDDYEVISNLDLDSSSELASIRSNLYLLAIPEASLFFAAHREGITQISADSFIAMPKGLFDTDALHGSCISKAFVKRTMNALAPFLKPCKGWTRPPSR
jgi:hypothetical protein